MLKFWYCTHRWLRELERGKKFCNAIPVEMVLCYLALEESLYSTHHFDLCSSFKDSDNLSLHRTEVSASRSTRDIHDSMKVSQMKKPVMKLVRHQGDNDVFQ